MNILAFDTTTSILSIAVQTSSGDRTASIIDIGLRHGELLPPEISRLLTQLDMHVSSLDLIICTRGPGSFTGLRIGMATAKGLSSGSGVPMVSVNVPDVLARPYSFFEGPVIPVIDGKKNRFYGAAFRGGQRTCDYFDLDAETIIQNIAGKTPSLITGPDSELFKSRMSPGSIHCFTRDQSISIFDLIESGIEQFKKHGADKPGQGPLYIRKSDAELSLEIRNGTG